MFFYSLRFLKQSPTNKDTIIEPVPGLSKSYVDWRVIDSNADIIRRVDTLYDVYTMEFMQIIDFINIKTCILEINCVNNPTDLLMPRHTSNNTLDLWLYTLNPKSDKMYKRQLMY